MAKAKAKEEHLQEVTELALGGNMAGISTLSKEEIKPIGALLPQASQAVPEIAVVAAEPTTSKQGEPTSKQVETKAPKDLLGEILYGRRVDNHITLPVSAVTRLTDIVMAVRRSRLLGSRDRLSVSTLIALLLELCLEQLEDRLGPEAEKVLAERIQTRIEKGPIGAGGGLEAALDVLREVLGNS